MFTNDMFAILSCTFVHCFVFCLSLPYPVDCGDYVVVSNAKQVVVTGRKEDQLLYRKHSMFPGGLKETPYKVMKERKPDEVRQVIYYNNKLTK